MKALKVLALFIILSLMGVSSLMTISRPGNRSLELTVCPQGPPTCDFAKIQEAIDAAPEGATIRVLEGTYAELLAIRKSLRLIGAGQERVFLKRVMPQQSSQTWLDPTVIIEAARLIQVWIEGLSITGPLSPMVQEPHIMMEGIRIKEQIQAILQKLTVSGHSYGINIVGDSQVILQEVTLSRNFGGIMIAEGFFPFGQKRIRNSTIVENVFGIFGTDFVLEGSTVTKNQEAGIFIIGRSPGLRRATRILENTISENGRGVLLQQGLRSPREGEVMPSVEIFLNRIVGNREYGVVILTAECMGVKERAKSGPLWMELAGGGNEMRDNGKGDLCPADYPWPLYFKKP